MKNKLLLVLAVGSFFLSAVSFAQQASPTDNMAVSAGSEVKNVDPASAPQAAAASKTPATKTAKMAKSSKKPPVAPSADTAAAAGGDKSLVWLNTNSKVYHCYGGKYYGKTKVGSYMSEDKAIADGGHATGNKKCSI